MYSIMTAMTTSYEHSFCYAMDVLLVNVCAVKLHLQSSGLTKHFVNI